MKITLKKIEYLASMSRETNCFTAEVYVDGVHMGYAHNEGGGGPTIVGWHPGKEQLYKQAEQYCASLPPEIVPLDDNGRTFEMKQDLESVVDDLVCDFITGKEQKKADNKYAKKLKKAFDNGICFGTDDSYSTVKLSVTIKELVDGKHGQKGFDFLIKSLNQAKGHMKANERILNDNIPAEFIKQVFGK